MNLKNDNISTREMFIQKIEKLKIIISLYKQDINQAIVDLNFIYDNYKKFIEEKNKEKEKYLKKEKYLNDSNIENINNKKAFNKMKLKNIINAGNNKIYIYVNLITFFFIIIISIAICIMWSRFNLFYTNIMKLIRYHGNLSNDGTKLIIYYQLMVYYNITISDINKFERYNITNGEDLFYKIYKVLTDLYDTNKIKDKLGEYDIDNLDSYYDYNCSSFYEDLFKNDPFLKNQNINYKGFFIAICESSKIFDSNNYKKIFSILYENIQIGINKINVRSYDELISNFYDNTFTKIIILYITVYYYAFKILGAKVQTNSYEKIESFIIDYSNIRIALIYVCTFILIILIIFFYLLRINSNYNKINEVKKVFKICNKKD